MSSKDKVKLIDNQELDQIYESAWMGFDTSKIKIPDELGNIWKYDEPPGLVLARYVRKPENFGFLCNNIFNVKLLPFQLAILKNVWAHPFPMLIGSRGLSKSFTLSLYAMMRALLKPNHKVVIAGAGFRQSKHLFEYTKAIWSRAPVLRSLCRGSEHQGPHRDIDRCTMQIGDSRITFLPVGSGATIRGERAHTLIVDEFSVLPLEIYEVVLKGFTSTSSDPVTASIKQQVNEILKEKYGFEVETVEGDSNQSIISGTCDYDFQHFASYWKRYKEIIHSKGDKATLDRLGLDENVNYKSYSIIRIPYDLLPKGFLDASSVSSSKATMMESAFAQEYGCIFSRDSDGFFKRRLIDACTVNPNASDDAFPSDASLFEARIHGNPERKYVYGIDPASESDNFSIIILELHQKHTRIVYCWTTNKKEHKSQLKAKLTKEQNFYAYVVRKVRQLMRTFPPVRIGCDSQGGGVGVREAFYDDAHIEEHELPIYEIPSDDPKKPKDTDGKAGLHILELVNFAKADWTTEANTGMRKDFEDKVLLFPYFDAASLEMAAIEDQAREEQGKLYDTLEDCIWEIEELKAELASIVETKTAAQNRSRWDTPEIKLPNNKKGRLRKDRYSALLIANMIARTIQRTEVKPEYQAIGGFANKLTGKVDGGIFYSGPNASWVASVQDFFS